MKRWTSADWSMIILSSTIPLAVVGLIIMRIFTGPLNGILLSKTSNRTLSMIGVSLMTSSLVVFAYLQRYEYMYPVFGIGFGELSNITNKYT